MKQPMNGSRRGGFIGCFVSYTERSFTDFPDYMTVWKHRIPLHTFCDSGN